MPAKKKMTDEAFAELDPTDRIIAHIEQDYELREEDRELYERISVAYRIIHSTENADIARRRLGVHFGRGVHLTTLINQVTQVFGDYMKVNRHTMRVLQEKRYNQIHKKAMINENLEVALGALKAIDSLYDLKNQPDSSKGRSKKLPRAGRSSDPNVFTKQLEKMSNG